MCVPSMPTGLAASREICCSSARRGWARPTCRRPLPGKALSGFVKKTVPDLPVYAVETVADVEALVQKVKEEQV